MLQLQPPEVRNMRIMEIHYQDTLKAYDSWFWMPSIRRVRRRSTSERQDAQGGVFRVTVREKPSRQRVRLAVTRLR